MVMLGSPQVEKESDHTAPSTSLTQALLGSVSLGNVCAICCNVMSK
jgi:hypothetical protein